MWIDRQLLAEAPTSQYTITSGCAFLLLSIITEVVGTCCMKLSTYAAYELCRIPAYMLYALSFSLFPEILKTIPTGIAYATWSALGTVLTCLISVLLFDEHLDARQCVAILCILVCCFVLHAVDAPQDTERLLVLSDK